MLAVAVIPRLPTLLQPLLEKHAFRQTWTAFTALIYHERGIDLLHAEVPVFGPPFFQPQEFPLFQAIAALIMDVGVPTDPAMRVTGLLCFFATAAAFRSPRQLGRWWTLPDCCPSASSTARSMRLSPSGS